MNKNKWKPCGSNTAETYKSVRSLRYSWDVYMRELSFLGSFPQTSAHIRAGGTTKPAAWHAHTHPQKNKHRYSLVPPPHCSHNPQPLRWMFASHFYFQLYFMPLHTTRDLLQSNPSITVKQWIFHGSIAYCGNKLLYQCSEINGPLGSLHQSPSFCPP